MDKQTIAFLRSLSTDTLVKVWNASKQDTLDIIDAMQKRVQPYRLLADIYNELSELQSFLFWEVAAREYCRTENLVSRSE